MHNVHVLNVMKLLLLIKFSYQFHFMQSNQMDQLDTVVSDVVDQVVVPCDSTDCVTHNPGVEDVVYTTSPERSSWTFFNYKVSRSFAVFITQVLVAMFLIAFSCVNLFISQTCEDKSIYIALLSSSVGYFLPNPKL